MAEKMNKEELKNALAIVSEEAVDSFMLATTEEEVVFHSNGSISDLAVLLFDAMTGDPDISSMIMSAVLNYIGKELPEEEIIGYLRAIVISLATNNRQIDFMKHIKIPPINPGFLPSDN